MESDQKTKSLPLGMIPLPPRPQACRLYRGLAFTERGVTSRQDAKHDYSVCLIIPQTTITLGDILILEINRLGEGPERSKQSPKRRSSSALFLGLCFQSSLQVSVYESGRWCFEEVNMFQ